MVVVSNMGLAVMYFLPGKMEQRQPGISPRAEPLHIRWDVTCMQAGIPPEAELPHKTAKVFHAFMYIPGEGMDELERS